MLLRSREPTSVRNAAMSNVEIEREPDRIECIEAGALELVETPLDDGVRRRTLEPRREREERWLPQ